MDTSANLKNSHTKLQLTIPHWNSMLVMISLQKMTGCKSVMHFPIIFLLTLQLVYVKIPPQWFLIFFMIQVQPTVFRRTISLHQRRVSLWKNRVLKLSWISSGKIKRFPEETRVHLFLTVLRITEIGSTRTL